MTAQSRDSTLTRAQLGRVAACTLTVLFTAITGLAAAPFGYTSAASHVAGVRLGSVVGAPPRCCHHVHVRFVQPSGIAVDAHGNVYVGDAATGRVVELAPSGRLLRQWQSRSLGSPLGIALDRQGDIFVTQQDTSVITKISPSGQLLEQWGRPHVDLVTFDFPHAVAVDSGGNLYVSDWGNNRVVKIDARGRPVAQWAMTGLDPGAFWHPLGITVDAHDHVYVVDEGGYRVEEFSSIGQFLGAWHTKSLPWLAISPQSLEYNSSYGYQAGVAVDPAGYMYVTNWRDASVRKLSPAGKVVAHWNGGKIGRFSEPSGIAISPDGTVYVADWGSGRLFKITSRIQPFIPWK